MLEALSGHLDEAEIAARHAIELQERAMSGTEGLLIVGAHSRLGACITCGATTIRPTSSIAVSWNSSRPAITRCASER